MAAACHLQMQIAVLLAYLLLHAHFFLWDMPMPCVFVCLNVDC